MDGKARRRWRREHKDELLRVEAFLAAPPHFEVAYVDGKGLIHMRRSLFRAFGQLRSAEYWDKFLKDKRVVGNV